ncbi:MAG: acetyltransferase [Bryobacteraceae bacterium]|nr:acetyltransferase [Bryobacteraceae bacterium]
MTDNWLRPGRLILTLIALMTGVSPFLADWNTTHIYNPYWPPHARFHNGQTMLMGAALALLTIWALWRRSGDQASNFFWAAMLTSLYWATQAGAILFPGAGYTDPQLGTKLPTFSNGVVFNQTMLDAVILPLVLCAYLWDRSRYAGLQSNQP